ncbi:hypothetical protein [Calidifontibacter terrae]
MGGTEATNVTAGIWGFVILFGLGLACWVLFRSMNRHLRKVRFEESDRERAKDPGVPKAPSQRPEDD